MGGGSTINSLDVLENYSAFSPSLSLTLYKEAGVRIKCSSELLQKRKWEIYSKHRALLNQPSLFIKFICYSEFKFQLKLCLKLECVFKFQKLLIPETSCHCYQNVFCITARKIILRNLFVFTRCCFLQSK